MSIVLLFVYNMLAELEELDESRGWPRLFQRLNWEASQKAGALTAARLPENRQLNRYRDVLPYDHSRIILKGGSPDYINANLVEITRLNKKYILTQGPLPHTAMHFWQMIWEQNTEAVVMLNRVVEKNQIKCYQYWPCGEAHGHVNHLEFGDFRIYYLREMRNEYFTIRSLELENILTGERRNIEHFHYLTWPDFGVPTSPATFLAFLFEVRKTGVMSADAGPCVIHCSAGIGRSGTFVMVDLILTEVERTGDMDQIDIKAMLLEIRQSRVGLIQTPDQLRFTYLAILEGVRVLMPEIYQTAQNHNEQRDAEEEEETPPPLPERRRLVATDEPATKKSRTSDHEPEPEPEPEKEVFSDNSEGSDEIINLSSLSESESEEDTDNKVQNEESSFVQAELQQTVQDHQPTDMKNQSTEEGQQHTNEVIQPTDDTPQHPEEGSLQSTDEGCQLAEKDLPSTSEGRQKTREGPAPTDHETKEGLVSTVEGRKETEEDLEPTVEGCQHLEEGVEPTVEGCQHLEEGFQPSDDGGVDKTDSITQIRKRRREERKQKVADLVENIKKNVKREEDAKVWKSRLKNSLMVVAVCSLAYITFRYFTSG